MYRLFLFFLFSFFISFNAVANNSGNSNPQRPTTVDDFVATGCQGSPTTDSRCKVGKKATEADKQLSKEAFKKTHGFPKPETITVGQSFLIDLPESDPSAASIACEADTATRCCSDPSTCLGGEALSSFQDISSIVTNAGPGLAMAMQGMGKDMYKLCQAMQSLAAGGAGLSMAAKGACSRKISSCQSSCNHQIRQQCELYRTAKKQCETKQITDTAFAKQGGNPANLINKYEGIKTTCVTQKKKAKDLTDNMGEMVNSALSAELCKQQTKIPKKQCLKNGGKWVDMKCVMPEEEKEERQQTVALRNNNGAHIPQYTGAQAGVISESPSRDSKGEPLSNPDDNPDSGGGGSSDSSQEATSPPGLPGLAAGTELDSDSDDSTGAGQGGKGSGSGLSGLSGLSGGGSGFSPYNRNKNDEDEEEDDALSMGGGGFAGYGGGGGGDSGNAYASLGLSKKKMDELKKKKGAKRVTASEAKGTHQNIFERISKRFQSLCQSKLDCR